MVGKGRDNEVKWERKRRLLKLANYTIFSAIGMHIPVLTNCLYIKQNAYIGMRLGHQAM